MTDASPMPGWALGPFCAPQRILEDRPAVTFDCPVLGEPVAITGSGATPEPRASGWRQAPTDGGSSSSPSR